MRRVRAAAAAAAILALWGCGKAAPAPPSPATTTTGPVNPDPHVTTYACADGETLTAGYPDKMTAMASYKGHAYTLKLARSGSGARYTGMGLQWWTKGLAHGTLTALKDGEDVATGPGLDCVAPPTALKATL